MTGFSKNYVKSCTEYDPILVNEITHVTFDRINSNTEVEVTLHDEVFAH